MNLIGRQELKETLDREEDTKLAMVLGRVGIARQAHPRFSAHRHAGRGT